MLNWIAIYDDASALRMSRYQPALLGGLFIGVLSSLPVVSTANICCCLWVIVGGGADELPAAAGAPAPVETQRRRSAA